MGAGMLYEAACERRLDGWASGPENVLFLFRHCVVHRLPIATVAQLVVTSKPSDGRDMDSNLGEGTRSGIFFLTLCTTMENDYGVSTPIPISRSTSEGDHRALLAMNLKASIAEGRWRTKDNNYCTELLFVCVTLPLCDPPPLMRPHFRKGVAWGLE